MTRTSPDAAHPSLASDIGTTVAVWAHPDDETYLSGGLLAALRDEGQRVVCVTATRGDAGNGLHDGGSPAERSALARTRTTELAAALDVLGVVEHHWLDYEDTGCPDVDAEEAVGRLLRLLDEVRPRTVVGFGPDGFTGHPDHMAVARWTRQAVDSCRPRPRLLQSVITAADREEARDVSERFDIFGLGSPPDVPEQDLAVRVVLEGAARARKVDALLQQHSQTAELVEAIGLDRFSRWVSVESFREA